jgi:DNA-binding NtrC family response regulator
VNRGTFRSDLFFRLSVVEVRLPPLRERPDDIPLLLEHLLTQGAGTPRRPPPSMLDYALRHDWPGNIRELRNFVERCVSLSDGEWVDADADVAPVQTPEQQGEARLDRLPFAEAKRRNTEAFEKQYLQAILGQAGGNVTQAARDAQMDRAYLTQLLKRYNLR